MSTPWNRNRTAPIVDCKAFQCQKLNQQTEHTGRKFVFRNYGQYLQGNVSDTVKNYIESSCMVRKVHLLSVLALLFPRCFLDQIDGSIVRRAISVLEQVKYVEYEDLNSMHLPLHKQTSCNSIWTNLFDCNQPTSSDLLQLSHKLIDACGQILILDLLKLIYGYLSAVVEQLHVGMPIDVFDSGFNWQIALIQDIVCTDCDEFILIHYVGWQCEYDEWISVHSVRIRLLRNTYGEIVREWIPLDYETESATRKLLCRFHHSKTGTWKACVLDQTMMHLRTADGENTNIPYFVAYRDLAPASSLLR